MQGILCSYLHIHARALLHIHELKCATKLRAPTYACAQAHFILACDHVALRYSVVHLFPMRLLYRTLNRKHHFLAGGRAI